jgi:AcrR family transcriptional regulator
MVQKSNRRSIGSRRPPRVSRYDARRDGILRAAARMFRERGFADTGMRDIAVASELSPANLYHYFKGKDEILFYCQDRALDRMLVEVARTRRASPRADERLRAVLVTHVLTMLDEVEGATAHLQVEALSSPLRERIVRKRDRYERGVRRLLSDGMSTGVFVDGDAALLTRAMLGALNWVVTWYRPGGTHAPPQIATDMAAYLVRGLVTK